MGEARGRQAANPAEDIELQKTMGRIKHKLIVISGKGGVGKSTIAVNLAQGLALRGYRVGVLDVDIHGPNIGKMLGIEGRRLEGSADNKIRPIQVDSLKVITMASLLEGPDSAVIWRGPLKMKIIKQFLTDVDWGQLDYLVMDSPPGTGDEPLSVAQLIPDMDGAVIVTTPQEVALLDSRKCVNFARTLKTPVLGIIENMSGLICPHCGGRIDLFKTGGGQRAAGELNVPFLGRVPIEPEIVISGDEGRPFILDCGKTKTGKVMQRIVGEIVNRVESGLNQAVQEARPSTPNIKRG